LILKGAKTIDLRFDFDLGDDSSFRRTGCRCPYLPNNRSKRAIPNLTVIRHSGWFGASAPGGVVIEKFGFTVDNVVAQAKAVLG
jgi:hypothetical protein